MESIPRFLSTRNDKLITNHYGMSSPMGHGIFHVVCYFLNEQTGKLIVRRIDSEHGWDVPLHIVFVDGLDTGKEETIVIDPSPTNEIIRNVVFRIVTLGCMENDYVQRIPKRIMQTGHSHQIWSLHQKQALLSFLEWNPEYEYEFFADNDCREFIKIHFDESYLEAFDRLIPNAFKSDFFRLCYIYKKGGCYFDNKHVLRMPLRRFIRSEDDCVYCQDEPPQMTHNGLICAVPMMQNHLDCLQHIINSVKNYNISPVCLGVTGPSLFYLFTSHLNTPLHFIRTGHSAFLEKEIFYDKRDPKNIVLYRRFPGYYEQIRPQDYASLHRKGWVFYRDYQEVGPYRIMRIPQMYVIKEQPVSVQTIKNKRRQKQIIHERTQNVKYQRYYEDRFSFSFPDPEHILVHRIDSDQGWVFPLTIVLIHNESHEHKEVYVGPSEHNRVLVRLR